MKILYFHQHYTNPNGTVGIRSYSMSEALSKEGHSVCIICGSYLGANTGLDGPFKNGIRRGFINDRIEIIELELPYSNKSSFISRINIFIRYALRSIWLALRVDYDVIFATSTPLTVALPGIFARWFRRKIFILEIRDLWPELPKAMGVIKNPIILGALAFLEKCSYKSAHHIVALSPGIKNGIIKKRISEKNISLIPNGCDFEIFANPSKSWRPKGINDNDFIALYAGTHGIANGLDSLLLVAEELQRRGRKDIKIVLIGEGKEKENLMKQALKDKITNIVFHKPVSKIKLTGLMSEANIGLQVLANVPAFYHGTSPNKFFDYISANLPVLNNYPGWIADLINKHECGYTVSPDNPMAFADALEDAADNPIELKSKGLCAKSLAIEKFDRKVLAIEFVNLFKEVYRHKMVN